MLQEVRVKWQRTPYQRFWKWWHIETTEKRGWKKRILNFSQCVRFRQNKSYSIFRINFEENVHVVIWLFGIFAISISTHSHIILSWRSGCLLKSKSKSDCKFIEIRSESKIQTKIYTVIKPNGKRYLYIPPHERLKNPPPLSICKYVVAETVVWWLNVYVRSYIYNMHFDSMPYFDWEKPTKKKYNPN